MKKGLILGLACSAVLVAACSADRLTVPNPNTATQEAAAGALGAFQLQVTGVFRQLRNGRGAYITATARLGREGYIYTPNDGRNTSHFLIGIAAGANRLDPAGFAVGVWAGPYGNLRDILVTKGAVESNTALTTAQRSAARGVLRTIEALELMYVISTRDSLGAVTTLNADPAALAPFASRTETYTFILGALDAAYAELQAGGTTFPFTLHAGFAGFTTPATFGQFNRALAARAAAHFATSGGGTAAWTRAAAAISQSFLNRSATTAGDMNRGVYHVYSLGTGDAANGIDRIGNQDFLVHPSYTTDAQLKADLTRDNRYLSKVSVLATARNAPQALGIPTNLAMNVYPTQSTSVPIIRNEELVLLDAEIRLANADRVGAIQNINAVRTNIGGLPATTVTIGSPLADIETAILYEKRFSLLAEGHRWVDMRRYGRLATLPRDILTGITAHFVARVMPLPQAECLSRVGQTGALAGPGC